MTNCQKRHFKLHSCQNHSADDAVHACAKGPVFRGRIVDRLHTQKGERRERRGTQLTCQIRDKEYRYSPWGPEMLMDSLMLGSIYSHVKEPLRNTLSKYKAINKREKRHGEA